jgi:hypothetical protein
MTNRFTTLAATAALFIGLSGSAAAADPVKIGTAAGWTIYSGSDSCAGGREFANGTALSFVVGSSGVGAIVISNPKWNIPDGDYSVFASVDRTTPHKFPAKAEGKHVVLIWNINQDEINILSNGAIFRATVGQVDVAYPLTGSAEMLQAVGRCAVSRLSVSNPFANAAPPASTTPSNPFVETPSNPYRRM